MQHISLPASQEELSALKAGDKVLLSGVIFTGRDAAHMRLMEMIGRGQPLPFEINAIYYTGPCPASNGRAIGSCGPTTSSRMDRYTPALIERGLNVMIGKGERSNSVIKAMIDYGAVYFAAVGGAGALLSECVLSCEAVAFPDLGSEAIYRLEITDFPVILAIDSRGKSIYKR